MTPTETGLYGCPGDYGPHFRSLEYQFSRMKEWHAQQNTGRTKWSPWDVECAQRSAVVTAILDLAEDLDARRLVLVPEDEIEERIGNAYSEGCRDGEGAASEHY